MKIWDNSLLLIAVRLDSKRLPNKALKKVNGLPLLSILIERLLKIIPNEKIIVCTSNSLSDKRLFNFSKKYKIGFFAGNKLDVMKRFIDCGLEHQAKTLVRVTGDNPLTDPYLITNMLKNHHKRQSEYTYTVDFPIGTRPEIIDLKALIRIHSEIKKKNCTEYMTYMLKRPDKLKVNKFTSKKVNKEYSNLSLTVDTKEDFNFLKKILSNVNFANNNLDQILSFIEDNKSKFADRFIIQKDILIPSRYLYKNEKSKSISYCPCL